MRNFQAKDIVLVRDSNQVGVTWRFVDVTEIFPGAHGLLWRVELDSKNLTTVKASRQYYGKSHTVMKQSVQRLAMVPALDKEKTK